MGIKALGLIWGLLCLLLAAGAAPGEKACQGVPGDRRYSVSSACKGSATVGTESVKIACVKTVAWFDEPGGGAADAPASGAIAADEFVKLLSKADNMPPVHVVGKTVAAGKQAPEAVELGLRATGASYDPKSKALIISARPLAGQPLETAVRKLSVVTALFQPMTFPVFRAAAPPNASNAINTSDPASVAAHPENFIAESKFPVVTDAPRAPPRGANATPPLTYTISYDHNRGAFARAKGSKTQYVLSLATAGSAVSWYAPDKGQYGQQPDGHSGFVGLWGGAMRAGAGAGAAGPVGYLTVQRGPTAGCSFSFTINNASLSNKGAAAAFTITPHDPAKARACGGWLGGLNSKSARPSPGQALLVTAGDAYTADSCLEKLSEACTAPYLGGGFLVLEAYPYPKLPSSPDLSGIFASNAPLNEYMKNYPLFTLKSMSENAYQQPADHACEASMISKTYTSTSDARTEFSSKVSVAAEFWGVSGSASAAYEQASETMRSGNSTYTAATIMCGIHAYELPANLYGLKLTDSFVKTVELVVNNSYDTKAMELLYKTFGSHFVSTVVLGGFVSTSMGSSAASISQQTSSGVSVSAAISYGMASVSSSTESKSFKGATAQDLGWSWSAIMSPAGAGAPDLTYTKDGLPDMVAYQNALSELSLAKMVPVQYSITDFKSSVFSSLLYSQLWQGTSVTSAQLTQLAGLYDLFVKGCGGVAANCFLNTQGCGNYGYSTGDNSSDVRCQPCLQGLVASGSPYEQDACPYYSTRCDSTPAYSVPFACVAPQDHLWTLPGPNGNMSSENNCLHSDGRNALTSKSGQWSVVMQSDGNIVLYNNFLPSSVSKVAWSSGTAGTAGAPYKLCMARSGMLFAQNAAGSIFYQVNTGGGTACVGNGAPYILVMQDDGNLVIYDRKFVALWNTNSWSWKGGSDTTTAAYVGACKT